MKQEITEEAKAIIINPSTETITDRWMKSVGFEDYDGPNYIKEGVILYAGHHDYWFWWSNYKRHEQIKPKYAKPLHTDMDVRNLWMALFGEDLCSRPPQGETFDRKTVEGFGKFIVDESYQNLRVRYTSEKEPRFWYMTEPDVDYTLSGFFEKYLNRSKL